MRFGQVEQLFDAGAKADAEPLAAAEGDQRMRQLVALAVGILPGIHEAENPLAPIGRGPDHDDEADRQQQQQPAEDAHVDAAEEEDAGGNGENHHEGAEVGLLQQQEADQDHDDRHRPEAAQQAAHVVKLARSVVRGIQHGEQFHQFRWLQIHGTEADPALGAIDRAADKGHQHQEQQHEAGEEQPGRSLLPHAQRNLEGHHARDEADDEEHRVAIEEVRRLVAGKAAALGHRNRGGIHHHQPEQQETGRRPQQQGIEFGGPALHALRRQGKGAAHD